MTRQQGMTTSIILGDAHTQTRRHQSIFSDEQDGSQCDPHHAENQKRGGYPPQKKQRSAYPQNCYSSVGAPAL
jgi:hypothetical protein